MFPVLHIEEAPPHLVRREVDPRMFGASSFCGFRIHVASSRGYRKPCQNLLYSAFTLVERTRGQISE